MMYEKKIPLDLECTVVLTQEVLRGKWKPCLLANIEAGIRRPSELHKQLPHATPRVLNMQLRQLEAHELITKTVFDQRSPRVEYHLTPLGRTLLPVVLTLAAWGDSNRAQLQRVVNRHYPVVEAALAVGPVH